MSEWLRGRKPIRQHTFQELTVIEHNDQKHQRFEGSVFRVKTMFLHGFRIFLYSRKKR